MSAPSPHRRLTGLFLFLCAGLVLAPAAPAQDEEADAIEWSIEAPLASRSLLLGGAVAEDRLVTVGEWGHILVSDDQGASWRQQKVPTRANLTAVYFHDRETGWAVGHDAVVVRTVDGGETWERVHWAPEEERPLLDVFFEDAERGFAIGAYGFFLTTEDGGETWTSARFNDLVSSDEDEESDDGGDDYYDYYGEGAGIEYHLNQVARAPSGRFYIAGEAGTVFRSDDGGASWEALPSPYEGSFFGVLPLAGDEVLLFGLRGHLFRSEDGGESWTEVQTGTLAMLTSGLRLSDGRIVIAGLSGNLLVSDDGGRSFTLHSRTDRQGFSDVLPTGDGGLVLVGEFGVTKVTFDNLNAESGAGL